MGAPALFSRIGGLISILSASGRNECLTQALRVGSLWGALVLVSIHAGVTESVRGMDWHGA
jgi:hypothetical protein